MDASHRDVVFVDTNIPMYAAGSEHPLKLPCMLSLEQLSTSGRGVVDTEVIQEILYRFWSIRMPDAGRSLAEKFMLQVTVLPVTPSIVQTTMALMPRHPSVPPMDLIHVAVMQSNGIRRIVSADRHFDQFEGIERTAPDAFAAATGGPARM